MRDHKKLKAFELADALVLACELEYQLSVARRLFSIESLPEKEAHEVVVVIQALIRSLSFAAS
jgi:hypothetical protein